MKISSPATPYGRASVGATLLFLLVAAAALAIFLMDLSTRGGPLYLKLLREDGVVERLTAGLLFFAALISLVALLKLPEPLRWARLFLALFAIFSGLMALEEISWGQRALQIQPTAFWQDYSDQKETNVHNVVQHYLRSNNYLLTTTRKIAAVVLLIYGVVFPLLNACKGPRALFRKLLLVVPPPALALGFLLGALLAWFDWPTGSEEEIGELFFALCFALLVPLWLLQQRYGRADECRTESRNLRRRRS